MRIIQQTNRPAWWRMDQAEGIRQGNLVKRLFLHNESIKSVFYFHNPDDGLIYLDCRMSSTGPMGDWHKYWVCFRFEWLRALDEIRDLYQGALEAHDRMFLEIEEQMQRISESYTEDATLIHDWRKDGF